MNFISTLQNLFKIYIFIFLIFLKNYILKHKVQLLQNLKPNKKCIKVL